MIRYWTSLNLSAEYFGASFSNESNATLTNFSCEPGTKFLLTNILFPDNRLLKGIEILANKNAVVLIKVKNGVPKSQSPTSEI